MFEIKNKLVSKRLLTLLATLVGSFLYARNVDSTFLDGAYVFLGNVLVFINYIIQETRYDLECEKYKLESERLEQIAKINHAMEAFGDDDNDGVH